MVRPYDPSEYAAQHAFEQFPQSWQIDEIVQIRFERIFDDYRADWDGAQSEYNSLADYIYQEYGEDLDDYFDWDDWRENYDATA